MTPSSPQLRTLLSWLQRPARLRGQAVLGVHPNPTLLTGAPLNSKVFLLYIGCDPKFWYTTIARNDPWLRIAYNQRGTIPFDLFTYKKLSHPVGTCPSHWILRSSLTMLIVAAPEVALLDKQRTNSNGLRLPAILTELFDNFAKHDFTSPHGVQIATDYINSHLMSVLRPEDIIYRSVSKVLEQRIDKALLCEHLADPAAYGPPQLLKQLSSADKQHDGHAFKQAGDLETCHCPSCEAEKKLGQTDWSRQSNVLGVGTLAEVLNRAYPRS
ncbi:hypothetical protein CALCODRAFT_164361 [Calocera cornea HHB12733]|uniref:Uncharacterized protein n=1 Tax=Calocera cornea HHB12733 TaxID=1353952 RepID=A0A165CIB8_9BASI|nr:hypothetical protein CALCODRAFT_164361 [Calocera cornea HHB12733]